MEWRHTLSGIYSAHTSGLAQHSGGRGNVTHAMQNATNEGPAERVYAPMPRGDTELDRLKPRVCGPDTQWDMTQGQRQIEQATPRARTFTTSMVQGMLSPQRTGPRNRRDPRIQVGSRGAPASSARTLFLWPERGARPEHHSELQIPAGRRAPSRSIYPHPEIHIQRSFFQSRLGYFDSAPSQTFQNHRRVTSPIPTSSWIFTRRPCQTSIVADLMNGHVSAPSVEVASLSWTCQ